MFGVCKRRVAFGGKHLWSVFRAEVVGGIDLCIQHAMLFDGAVCLGAYAATKDKSQQEHEAWAVMQVNIPIMMVHGLDDIFCRPQYKPWHLRLEVAMQNPHGDEYGMRAATFANFVLPGDHDVMERLFYDLAFDDLADPY